MVKQTLSVNSVYLAWPLHAAFLSAFFCFLRTTVTIPQVISCFVLNWFIQVLKQSSILFFYSVLFSDIFIKESTNKNLEHKFMSFQLTMTHSFQCFLHLHLLTAIIFLLPKIWQGKCVNQCFRKVYAFWWIVG